MAKTNDDNTIATAGMNSFSRTVCKYPLTAVSSVIGANKEAPAMIAPANSGEETKLDGSRRFGGMWNNWNAMIHRPANAVMANPPETG